MTVAVNWRDLAECRDLVTADDDPFFDGGEDNERAAIAICQLCPVQQVPTGHFNASKTRCKRGHLFDAANTHYAADGSRRCRACLRDAYVAWARRAKRQAGPSAREVGHRA